MLTTDQIEMQTSNNSEKKTSNYVDCYLGKQQQCYHIDLCRSVRGL